MPRGEHSQAIVATFCQYSQPIVAAPKGWLETRADQDDVGHYPPGAQPAMAEIRRHSSSMISIARLI
jgi:hypothetical protein